LDTYSKSNYIKERKKKRRRGNTQYFIVHGIAKGEAYISPPPEIFDHGGIF
jgi:hypothetical protein